MSADFSAVGLAVGHATDERGATGLTVLRGVDKARLLRHLGSVDAAEAQAALAVLVEMFSE